MLPSALPPCRQDHSYLLQAFRFFIRNNYLLDYTAGTPLELPPPPAYPPPAPGPPWGRLQGEQEAAQPTDVRALLATVAKEAIDVELSDEEDGLLLPDGGVAGVPAAAVSGEEESGGEEESSSGEEEEEEEEAEGGALAGDADGEDDEGGEFS